MFAGYLPILGLNMGIYSVKLRLYSKYGPEKNCIWTLFSQSSATNFFFNKWFCQSSLVDLGNSLNFSEDLQESIYQPVFWREVMII